MGYYGQSGIWKLLTPINVLYMPWSYVILASPLGKVWLSDLPHFL